MTKYINEALDALVDQNQKDVAKFALSCYDLGKPMVATVNRIVASGNMKVGAYTIAAQPDIPRNITLARTDVGDPDTAGTVKITGTNINDEPIEEVLTPGATTVTVVGTKAFKTVTSVEGIDWVADEDPDTIVVGIGNLLGVPFAAKNALDIPFGVLGGTMLACSAKVTDPPTVEGTTIDMNAGTYDAAKEAQVLARYSA